MPIDEDELRKYVDERMKYWEGKSTEADLKKEDDDQDYRALVDEQNEADMMVEELQSLWNRFLEKGD